MGELSEFVTPHYLPGFTDISEYEIFKIRTLSTLLLCLWHSTVTAQSLTAAHTTGDPSRFQNALFMTCISPLGPSLHQLASGTGPGVWGKPRVCSQEERGKQDRKDLRHIPVKALPADTIAPKAEYGKVPFVTWRGQKDFISPPTLP